MTIIQNYRLTLIIFGGVVLAATLADAPERIWQKCTIADSRNIDLLNGPTPEGVVAYTFILSVLSLSELLITGMRRSVRCLAIQSFIPEFSALQGVGFVRQWGAYLFAKLVVLSLAGGWFWIVSYLAKTQWPEVRGLYCVALASFAMALPVLLYRWAILILAMGMRYLADRFVGHKRQESANSMSLKVTVSGLVFAALFHGLAWPLVFVYGFWIFAGLLVGMDILQWLLKWQFARSGFK